VKWREELDEPPFGKKIFLYLDKVSFEREREREREERAKTLL
jgi:hypothetical protein